MVGRQDAAGAAEGHHWRRQCFRHPAEGRGGIESPAAGDDQRPLGTREERCGAGDGLGIGRKRRGWKRWDRRHGRFPSPDIDRAFERHRPRPPFLGFRQGFGDQAWRLGGMGDAGGVFGQMTEQAELVG